MLLSTCISACRKGRPGREGRRLRAGLRGAHGFTLIETLVAAAVLVTGLTVLLGLLDSSVKASSATHKREAATNLARQVLEDARGIPYAQLSPTTIVSQLQAMPGLKNEGSGSAWQVVRSSTTYTITVTECSIDDGKGPEAGTEEWGVHKNSFGENPFCKDAGEKEWTGAVGEKGPDPQPEDLKRITAVVTWSAQGRTPEVRQVETVSSAGAAPGLNATNLKLESPAPDSGTATEPVITKETTTALTFSVSSPTGTAAMRWALEGIPQENAPTLKEGTTWTFTWSIPKPGVSDGTYTVAVQAIDKRGVLGPPVSIQVTLIRGIPAAPPGLKGGFNTVNVAEAATKVVELKWQANSERNVIGYRVYRPGGTLGGGSSEGLVCPGSVEALSTATSCIDFSPPNPVGTASERKYKVVALYRNVEKKVAEGTVGILEVVGGPPPAPSPPETLTVKPGSEEGTVQLEWQAPKTSIEPVIFYRIYRSGKNYTNRYDLTGGTTYLDSSTAEQHEYWVTSVDGNLTESSFLGPVKG